MTREHHLPVDIMENFMLPAVRLDRELPENEVVLTINLRPGDGEFIFVPADEIWRLKYVSNLPSHTSIHAGSSFQFDATELFAAADGGDILNTAYINGDIREGRLDSLLVLGGPGTDDGWFFIQQTDPAASGVLVQLHFQRAPAFALPGTRSLFWDNRGGTILSNAIWQQGHMVGSTSTTTIFNGPPGNLRSRARGDSGGLGQEATWVTKNQVTTAGFTTLHVDWVLEGAVGALGYLCLADHLGQMGDRDDFVLRLNSPALGAARQVLTLDITAQTLRRYVRLHAWQPNNNTESSLRAYRIWLT